MKIVAGLFAVMALTFSSCKKCYECTSTSAGHYTKRVCKEEPLYESIRKGYTLTDEYGGYLVCR